MAFCPNCRKEIELTTKFCMNYQYVVIDEDEIMPILIQSVAFSSLSGNFNSDSDSKKVNEVMRRLQQNGAKILDVKVTVADRAAIYLITYETPSTQ